MELMCNCNSIKSLEALKKLNVTMVLVNNDTYSSGKVALNESELVEFVKTAHRLTLKVFLRVDCLYYPQELGALENYLKQLDVLDVDGVLFTDMAVKLLCDRNQLKLTTIYAAETYLTNYYDVQAIKDNGINNCVVSYDIPLSDSYTICEKVKDYCYIRIAGEVLASYSARRFVSLYLDQKQAYLDGYYLKEETRDFLMPVIEKNRGTWIYGYTLESIKAIKEIITHPFKGIIIDNVLADEETSIAQVKIYHDLLQGNIDEIEARSQLDKQKKYIGIENVRKTDLVKTNEN